MLSVIADVLGIVSFILTIILLMRSESLRNEIVSQKINYRNTQSNIVKQLSNFRSALTGNEDLSLKTVSDIRKELLQFDINLRHLLSHRDRKIIQQTLILLDKDFSIELRKELIKNLDYLSARFTKQEV